VNDLLERESSCGCPNLTPSITYGRQGWHYRRSEERPASPQADAAFEPCPAYRAAARRNDQRQGARR
jgi:hypothetical protein